MEIIGETKSGFIVNISTTEMYNLVGFYSQYTPGRCTLSIGQKIEVATMYQHLYKLEQQRGQLSKVAETLKGIASLLEIQNPIIDEITPTL